MPRFVILQHQTPPGAERPPHFDFMLEDDGKLLTWALPEPPSAGRSLAATLLSDHRLEYLSYEGEIRGGRGSVTRWDAGDFEWLERGDDVIRVRLHGGSSTQTATLTRSAKEDWTFLSEQH